ncbi:uncharacterized protein LOC123498207 [Portunus trituberculatus]|uniref:uncharacterized protein LOC123498207 n=1 Tax=Portunus trituberculatus TaxID=210409 RepID=UPI001E1D1F17|nr:uncharacterized protein LOC123498207 [Portunus trituberculatus]
MPGQHNAVADILSHECVGSELTLHPVVCRQVFQVWGALQVDLFATALTLYGLAHRFQYISISSSIRAHGIFNFHGKKVPPTPKGVKGFVIRDEPQSDSEVSDNSPKDSEDEYLPSKDDDEVLRHDLIIDYEDEDCVVMGRSRRRTLLPELSAMSAEPSSIVIRILDELQVPFSLVSFVSTQV